MTTLRGTGPGRDTTLRTTIPQPPRAVSTTPEQLDALARRVPSLTHPARGVEAFATALVDDHVDFAQLAVRNQAGWLVAAQAVGTDPVPVHDYTVGRDQSRVMSFLMRQRMSETWVLPPDTPQRADLLRHLFGPAEVVAQVDALAASTLLVVPLVARGRPFGLMVVARPGADFDDAEIGALERVADVVAVSLDTCCVVSDNRRVAATLRRSLLPSPVAAAPRLDVGTYSRVAEEDAGVGGDFIDLHGPDGDQVLLLGDAVGKGVEAAVAAKRIRSAVRTGCQVDRDPAFVMGLTNRVIAAEDDDAVSDFATAVCARLRTRGDRLHVSLVNAGHPAPVVVRRDGTVETVEQHGPALGILDDATFVAAELELTVGDTLVCWTDGVTEARSDDGFFGDERVHALLGELAGAPSGAVVERVAMAVSEFAADRDGRDDTAIVAVRLLPEAP